MNRITTFSCSAIWAIAGVFQTATAQTCASPAAWHPGIPAGASLVGTTCGGDTTAAGYCGGNLDAPGPAYVIQATFAANRTFQTI